MEESSSRSNVVRRMSFACPTSLTANRSASTSSVPSMRIRASTEKVSPCSSAPRRRRCSCCGERAESDGDSNLGGMRFVAVSVLLFGALTHRTYRDMPITRSGSRKTA